MPLQSHGRVCLAVVLCVGLLFLVFKFRHDGRTLTFSQYSHLGKSSSNSIFNETLGFEKIFVINTPWRTDRKDSISLAASYSSIALEWIRGIDAEDIQEKAYPPGNHRQIHHGNLGSWRAHMDVMREIVVRNLTTALVLEDDADWDFRIRSQLNAFSWASRQIPGLILLADLLAARHPPASEEKKPNPIELAKRSSIALPFEDRLVTPSTESYGRDWDVLWLGHCGAELPPPSAAHPNRLMLLNDPTVPSPKHLKPTTNARQDPFASIYPPHSRLYHRTSNDTLCTLAYAVTQAGARKILYQFGIHDFSKGYDFALSDYCNGLTKNVMKGPDGKVVKPMCLTVQPPLFSHFWGERGGSDIMGMGTGGKPPPGSRYVRWSVRGNLEGLVRGQEGIVEQWADEEAKI